MKIRIITVGGTIDKVYFDALSDYQVGQPGVVEILEDLPIGFEYEIESLMRKDSLDMTDEDRELVRQRVAASEEKKILITHGTDTMIETAKRIQVGDDKCVVLTGSLAPAGFKTSDAEFNVGTAIGVLGAMDSGVHIAMNGCVFDPHNSEKNREAQRFEHKPIQGQA
ncbi:MAG: asparaginase domain-containing protein [Planctomycetaceae bacterium]